MEDRDVSKHSIMHRTAPNKELPKTSLVLVWQSLLHK